MSLKRNLIANYLGQGWTALMGIAFVPIYIHYLGIEAYGLIGLFAVLLAWFTLLDLGMTPTLNRELARFSAGANSAESVNDLVRTFEIICGGMAFVIVLVVYSSSSWIARDWLNLHSLQEDQTEVALRTMGLLAALRFQEGLYRGAILGMQRHVWLNGVSAAMATLRGLGAVVVLSDFSPTIQAFFAWQVIISVLTLVMLRWAVLRYLPITVRPARFIPGELKEAWRFAAGMFATTLLALALTQIDKVLLSRLLSLEQFGIFAFSSAVAATLSQIVGPIAQSYFPKFSQLATQASDEAITLSYHQAAQLMTVMLVPAALVLILFGEQLLVVWTADLELASKASPLVALLAAGTVLNGFMHIPYMAQLAYGWSGLAARINLVAVILVIPAIFIIVPLYGMLGAAAIWLAINAGYVLIGIHFMHQRLLRGEKYRWYFRDLLLPSVSAVFCAIVMLYLQPVELGRWASFSWIAMAGLISILGAIVSAPLVTRSLRTNRLP